MKMQVAERLISFLPQRVAQESFSREVFGLLRLSFKKEFLNFSQMLARSSPDVIVGLAFPQSVFIELDALIRHAAKNHCSQPAIADGQGVRPLLRRLCIP